MAKQEKENSGLKKYFTGGRLSFVFILIFLVFLLVSITYSPVHYASGIKEGEVSLRSIYAPYDFKYPWGINEEKTLYARNELIKSLPAVYDIDNSREEGTIRDLMSILDKAEGIKDKDRVKTRLANVITSIYPLGIISQEEKKELEKNNKSVKIRNPKIKTERVRPVKEILDPEEAKRISGEYIARIFVMDRGLKSYAREIVVPLILPNLIFNEQETNAIREKTIKEMPAVHNMVEVKKNELIVERGVRITKNHIAQLTELGMVGSITQKGPYVGGILLLLVILILAALAYLFIIEKKTLFSPKDIAIVLINSFILVLFSQFIIQAPQSDYIIPLAGSAMLIALLVNANIALLASLILSIFLGVIAGGKIEVAITLLTSGLVSIYVVRDARRRSKIILAGLCSGATSSATIISIGLLNNLDFKVFMYDALWGVGGGIISIFLVMGLLPLFEYIFKVTTNIALLELSDLNHPLLKELTLKAPGTYQHSIVVGNLAEAACEAIGANSLLARVGSYYHDIGKIEKAEYFSENEMGAQSKHEKLTPSMSALIIINHVKDAIETAKKHNLNKNIIDFIAQHHGTGLIYYFYQRALEKTKDADVLKEEEFRYPGPKPQTKEAAVVLLADSVEASSRALRDPTPARIRGLVQKIINNKFIDNQLNECDLTLKDLNRIAASFVRVLTAVFHARLEYPEKKNNGQKKVNDKNKRHKSK